MSDSDSWEYTTEKVGDRHALCCRTCRAAEARVTVLEAALAALDERPFMGGASLINERAEAAEAEVARLRYAAESYIETIRNPLNGPPARQEAIDALAAALAAPTEEGT